MPLEQTCWLTRRWSYRRSPPMRIHERLFLNPFEKWFRHGRFPVTFFLHIVLLVLASVQVLYYVSRDVDHIWRTTRHMSSLFLGIREGKLTISRPSHLQDALENAVSTYFNINNVSMVHYEFTDPDILNVQIGFRNRTIEDVTLIREYAQESGYLRTALPYLYNLELQTVELISISWGYLERVPEGHDWMTYAWRLNLRFDGSVIGEFWGNLESSIGTVGKVDYGHLLWKDILNSTVLVAAVICVGLITKKICRSVRIGRTIRRRIAVARAEAVQSEDVSLSEVDELPWGALLSNWWVISIISHALQIFASLTCMLHMNDVTARFALLGWSCFFTWMSICQYFQYFPAYYTTFSTTQNGLISICRYMVSVLPIFTAFMFLGLCLFWKESTFRSPSASYASLFSILNGDGIYGTFTDIFETGGWLGSLYLYLFIFIFSYIVLNVNITIIQESFLAAKADAAVVQEPATQPLNVTDERSFDVVSGNISLQDWALAADVASLDTGCPQPAANSTPAQTEHCSQFSQRAAAGSNLAGESTSDAESAPAWRKSQEPLLHTSEVQDVQLDPGSRARQRSTSPNASFSEEGARRLASESSFRRMSPRFRNPRLQRTLAVAFPEDLPSAQENEHIVRGRSGSGDSQQEETWRMQIGMRAPEAAASDLGLRASQLLWTGTLPLLTHALRTMTPQTLKETGDIHDWHELEQMLLDHCEAASSALAQLRLATVDRSSTT